MQMNEDGIILVLFAFTKFNHYTHYQFVLNHILVLNLNTILNAVQEQRINFSAFFSVFKLN